MNLPEQLGCGEFRFSVWVCVASEHHNACPVRGPPTDPPGAFRAPDVYNGARFGPKAACELDIPELVVPEHFPTGTCNKKR